MAEQAQAMRWHIGVGLRLMGLASALLAGGALASQEPGPSKTTTPRHAYDPLHVESDRADSAEAIERPVHDAARSRDIPIRVCLPAEKKAAPVVLFSHGLGGSRHGSAYLGDHWAARGYVVVYLQHPGSDESVWKDTPLRDRLQRMREAADLENLMLRVKDVPAVIDQLEKWNADSEHPLFERLDLKRLGMSGHSFGAVTTQAVCGQAYAGSARYREPRIRAAVMMSPSPPALGDTAAAFAQVAVPWMLLTGTHDFSAIGNLDPEDRRAVFPALPPEDKFELVLDRAEHTAFSDRPLPGDSMRRNPNHHRAILAVTTAFWDAYLREDPAAEQWLKSDQVRQVLEPADRWQTK